MKPDTYIEMVVNIIQNTIQTKTMILIRKNLFFTLILSIDI